MAGQGRAGTARSCAIGVGLTGEVHVSLMWFLLLPLLLLLLLLLSTFDRLHHKHAGQCRTHLPQVGGVLQLGLELLHQGRGVWILRVHHKHVVLGDDAAARVFGCFGGLSVQWALWVMLLWGTSGATLK